MLQHRQLDLCKSKDEKENEIMYLCRRMKLCGFLLKKGFNYEKIIADKEYYSIMWSRMNGFLKELGFAHMCAKDDFIPESLFYLIGMILSVLLS